MDGDEVVELVVVAVEVVEEDVGGREEGDDKDEAGRVSD